MNDKVIEKELLRLSFKAYKRNEMPVSAILVDSRGKIISKAYNKKNIKKNVLYHAEVLCLMKAFKKLKRWNLNDCTLYVSLEPCNMCKEVIEEARIDKVYYVLNKRNITNKYNKTQYEQMYGIDSRKFDNYVKNFFNSLRK